MNLKLNYLFQKKYYLIFFRLVLRKAKLYSLSKKSYNYNGVIHAIWPIDYQANNYSLNNLTEYKVFGTQVKFKQIDWHTDLVSDYQFPSDFIENLTLDNLANKGIDVKFPWELSRFYFAIKLAQQYRLTEDIAHYQLFKELATNWIDKNPFLYGVNWLCPMEVAIRATNLIVATNIFGEVFNQDVDFHYRLYNSLIQHADMIYAFPEVYKKGHSTNHTTADYAGLLFLSLALKTHKSSKKWRKMALSGLEECIRYQVREDGGHFESSIPYHRLVLEFFAYSGVVCLQNNIKLSDVYWQNLRNMFAYTASYIDLNGNAPLVGDNDSGRYLIFKETEESNHYYLLQLGRILFGEDILEKQQNDRQFEAWHPRVQSNKKSIQKPIPQEGFFKHQASGAYCYRTTRYRAFIAVFPIGMGGQGGHNHIDRGSLTLTVDGKNILIDPGTLTYTRSLKERQKFRSPQYHNFLVTNRDLSIEYADGFWDLKNFPTIEKLDVSENTLVVHVKTQQEEMKQRKIVFEKTGLSLEDVCSASFKVSFLVRAADKIGFGKSESRNQYPVSFFGSTKWEKEEHVDISVGYDQKDMATLFFMEGTPNEVVKTHIEIR